MFKNLQPNSKLSHHGQLLTNILTNTNTETQGEVKTPQKKIFPPERVAVSVEQIHSGLFCVQGEWKNQKLNPSVVGDSRNEVLVFPPSNFEFSFSPSTSAAASTDEEVMTCEIEFKVCNSVYFLNGSVKNNRGESSSSVELWSDFGTSRNGAGSGSTQNRQPCTVWIYFNDGDKQPHQFELSYSPDPKKLTRFVLEDLKEEYLSAQPPRVITFHLWIEFDVVTKGQKNILYGLTSMHDNQINCDVHFSFPNGEKIGAHYNILSAVTPILAIMFDDPAQEAATRQVNIDNIPFETFKMLLYYVYSGRLSRPLTDDMARSLYVAAFKYDMTDLKAICTFFLLPSVRMENALELLVWSDLYRVDNLKERILSFIAGNGWALSNTKDWDNLARNNHELCVTATRRIIGHLSNKPVTASSFIKATAPK